MDVKQSSTQGDIDLKYIYIYFLLTFSFPVTIIWKIDHCEHQRSVQGTPSSLYLTLHCTPVDLRNYRISASCHKLDTLVAKREPACQKINQMNLSENRKEDLTQGAILF